MTTIAQKLIKLAQSKAAIKQALVAKGVDTSVPFENLSSSILEKDTSVTTWNKPADWIQLPTLNVGEQKFVGLHAVYDGSNFVALSAKGNYTVDWGDGTINNYASGVVAEHTYDYNTYDVGGTTSCDRGYKQAIITVTPQVGQNLTYLNTQHRHSLVPSLNYSYNSGFLSIAINAPELLELYIGVKEGAVYNHERNLGHKVLEQFNLISSKLLSAKFLLSNCEALQSVPLLDLKNISDFSYLFNSCFRLRVIGVINNSGLTNIEGMFKGCSGLIHAPDLDTSLVTNMNGLFTFCNSLTHVPLYNTVNVTAMDGMFEECYSMRDIPFFNTANVTTMQYMFYKCYNVVKFPEFNTVKVTNMSGMFDSCYSMVSAPMFNTAAVMNMNSMFAWCYSLSVVPAYVVNIATQLQLIFNNCGSLRKVSMVGIGQSFSVEKGLMSASALNELYSNLANVTGKTITITGNPGISADNPSIATAKGWTVTGS